MPTMTKAASKSTQKKKEQKRRARTKKVERAIAKAQASTKWNIPTTVFKRLVQNLAPTHRVSKKATEMLHEEAEQYLTFRFTEAGLVAANANRETVSVNDMRTAERVRTLYPRAPPPPKLRGD